MPCSLFTPSGCTGIRTQLLDPAIGDKGLFSDKLYFTSEFDEGSSFVQFLYKYLGSSGPFIFTVRTMYSHTSIENCYLDLNNDLIEVPAGYAWPSGFATNFQDVGFYVTLGDYYQVGD